MSIYNQQQQSTLLLVREFLSSLPPSRVSRLEDGLKAYLEFREETARFQEEHFADLCTQECFADGRSACCGREGILTFFADVAINALLSPGQELDALQATLDGDRGGPNCVYLGKEGCLWRLKPITCEMFLCDRAKEQVLGGNDTLMRRWEDLREREKRFTLPVEPVLFDDLEALFIEAGRESPLMYFHLSPGLLRLKARHGVGQGRLGQKDGKGD